MKVTFNLEVVYNTDEDASLKEEYLEWLDDYPVSKDSFIEFCQDRFVDNYDAQAKLSYTFRGMYKETGVR